MKKPMRSACARRCRGAAIVVFIIAAGACASAPEPPVVSAADAAADAGREDIGLDNLNAVLWVQTAVEYRANSLQAYRLARYLLDDALEDTSRTAALEQVGDYAALPPAIILDIDETVLDNSFFEARLTLDNETYSEELWDAWALQEAATPTPGALDFIRYATAREVTVFYVTNRRAHLEAATRANMRDLGFPLREDIDDVLTRGELPEWEGSDKTPRRQKVAAEYRVLLMFGDNMGDFTAASSGSLEERRAFAERYRDFWGTRWITLANPTYGSFLGAVFDHDFSLTPAQQTEVKKRALDPRR
jgi:acid phosphatase